MEGFWILVILTASLIILLMHAGLLVAQIAFALITIYLIPAVFFLYLFIIQLLFGLWILYRVFKAAEFQTTLELEKTSRIAQYYTAESRSGIRKNFL
ncbi:hypothetical protein JCM21714_2428 [Gracilibacillus boraciitolerans JCM 21714]|uniref:Uncharacterized protein n=1 Tax=Gracilibacillus boraciitolerans JCM 21714 TaxID=1298598 RepID=W4VJL2_9BACI|nr:hypothetical protein [Gracilibacillus boraciitolerans]GAE93351.1 hypothetical protein JCM21714_2428 [Gracilibacillus boraciitolerans JCM 21714]